MLRTVSKAGMVLDLFTQEKSEWGVTELAGRLDLSKSNAHALLTSLEAINLLQRTSTARYRLGWRLVSMAGRVTDAALLRQHAPRHLQALARVSGATTHLAVWDGREMFFTAQALPPQGGMDMPQARPGSLLPGHATSTGKILLGSMPWPDAMAKVRADGFEALTPATITDEDRLRTEVLRAAEEGFAVSREEVALGVGTAAVPVHGPEGHIIAALGVSVEAESLTAFLTRHRRTMAEAAARLASALRAGPLP